VEQLVRAGGGADAVRRAQQDLATALAPALATARELAPPAVADDPAAALPAAATALDPASTREAAARLTELLMDNDPGAADFVAANRARLQPLFQGPTWAELERLVRDYAFAEALERLERAGGDLARP
jgi:hypothetical protein